MLKDNIVFDKENKILISSSGQKISYKNHFNSKQGDINCNDKALTSSILQKNNINVPRFIVWNNNSSNQTNLSLNKKTIKLSVSCKTNTRNTRLWSKNKYNK